MNSFRVLGVFTAAIIIGLLGQQLLFAQESTENPTIANSAGTTIRALVKPIDGESYEAEIATSILKVRTNFGLADIQIQKLKDVTFSVRENQTISANMTLFNGEHLDGELDNTTMLPLKRGQDLQMVPIQDLQKLTIIKLGDSSLLAILLGLLTLTLMEIVLGVDNVIFLAIVASKLPEAQQPKARRIGILAALGTRLLLLASLSWLLGLTQPVFTLPEMSFFESTEARGISWRDLILLVGGAFLIGKSTFEIHEKVESKSKSPATPVKKAASFASVIVQIAIIDIIFSLDSVITAVGMVNEIWVMVVAMLIAVTVMMIFAEPISRFVERRPTIKVLALSFLILIGVLLVAEGLGQHMNKGYIYFAMAFSLVIELLNMNLRKKPETQTPASS